MSESEIVDNSIVVVDKRHANLVPGGNLFGSRRNEKEEISFLRLRALSASINALEFLIETFKDTEQPIPMRIRAADMVLNRGLGKPRETLTIEDVNTDTPKTMSRYQLKNILDQCENKRDLLRQQVMSEIKADDGQ